MAGRHVRRRRQARCALRRKELSFGRAAVAMLIAEEALVRLCIGGHPLMHEIRGLLGPVRRWT
jgi:hypothetical protein